MKKIIFVLIVILFAASGNFAQESRYFDAPFGGGGGFTPGFTFPNVKPLNNVLPADFPRLTNKAIFTTGGAGFFYIGLVKFLRIGGGGYGGSTSELVQSSSDGFTREVRYSIGGGGLSIEYSLPFIRDFGVSVGAIIGGGSMQIQLYNNSGNFSWDGVWDETPGNNTSTNNISRTISNTYWNFTPTLNVDIPFNRFVALRVGTGYQITFANSWRVDNDIELTNVPSDLNANSFFVQAGVYLGFFSF